ncbi:MAG: hypothetical protein K5896_12800 [Prevotella sp.]|nr:hypothetical protein [Prevotella sp.]
MVLHILFGILFFTLLGLAYVKGYDVVKAHSPQHLVHFYLIMATVRMLLVGTAVAIYVLLIAQNRTDAIRFALIILIMYAIMMVVTLKLRH